MTRTVFVAPHSDDVALSCGGAVALEARSGDPLIVTVFAGQPTGDESAFARMQHERWGVEAASVVETRRAEDVCAAHALGERVQTASLDFLDAIYRHAAYDSDEALFGQLLAEDEATIDAIADALKKLRGQRVYIPQGIGNHVDHQIVFRAGRRLATRSVEVWAYTDVPYALNAGIRSTFDRIAAGEIRGSRLIWLDDDAWERRVKAIDCYTSQLPVIFRDHGDHHVALDRFLRVVGGGERAEICWRVHPDRKR